MTGLQYGYLLAEVSLPLQVAGTSLRLLAPDHPSSGSVPAFDDGVEDFGVPPEFLAFAVGLDLSALLMEGIDDMRCDIKHRSIDVFWCIHIDGGVL